MKYVAPPDVDANVAVGTKDSDDGANTNTTANADADDIANGIAKVHIDDDADAKGDVCTGAGTNHNGDDVNTGDCANVKSNVDVGTNVSAKSSVGADVNTGTIDDVNANAGTRSSANVGVSDSVKANGGADDEEKKLGLPSHTDKNLLTVLYQYEIEGLEVLTKDEKWIRLKPSHNSFVVMAGDSLYVSSNLFYF